jgi:membrane-bound lytic murein transglycosylase B
MVSITLSVSEKTKKLMNQFPEINWSGFIRKTIQQKVEELTWEQKMLEKLKQQESFDQWAVETTQKSRDKRIEELRKKGLL